MFAQWSISAAQQQEANQWAQKYGPYTGIKDGLFKDRVIGRLGESSVKHWLQSQNVRVTEGDKYCHDLICYTPCGTQRLEIKTTWCKKLPTGAFHVGVRLDQFVQQHHDTNFYVFPFVHYDETQTLVCTVAGFERPNIISQWDALKEGQLLSDSKTPARYDMYVCKVQYLSPLNYLLAYLQ